MSEVAVWNCELSGGRGPGLEALTVGSPFLLKCKGDVPIEWDKDKSLEFIFAKEDEAYTLAPLAVHQLNSNEAEIEVTGYKPGEHKPAYVRVLQNAKTEKEKGFEILKPVWKIQSVIQAEGGQKPEPFPPLGPWSVGLPGWVWVVLALVVAGLVTVVVEVVRRQRRKRKLALLLKEHTSAALPVFQFQREGRLSLRRMSLPQPPPVQDVAQRLDQALRVYILRRFEVFSLNESSSQILNSLRSNLGETLVGVDEELRQVLRELDRLKLVADRSERSVKDLEQVYKMALSLVDQLELAKKSTEQERTT